MSLPIPEPPSWRVDWDTLNEELPCLHRLRGCRVEIDDEAQRAVTKFNDGSELVAAPVRHARGHEFARL